MTPFTIKRETFFFVFTWILTSAYVSRPHYKTYRNIVHKSETSSHLLQGLKTGDDSFEEKRSLTTNLDQANKSGHNKEKNPTHNSLPIRVHNVGQFCHEVGCTVQDYQRTTQSLRRLKVELSNKMLSVEDELNGVGHNLELENIIYHEIPNHSIQTPLPPSLPFQSWLSSSLKALQNTNGNDIKSRIHKSINEAKRGTDEARSENIIGGRSSTKLLLKRRKRLSDRALAIQNLLTTLQAMEETEQPTPSVDMKNMDVEKGKSHNPSAMGNTKHGTSQKTAPITSKELAQRYRMIAGEEGIKVTSKVTFNIRETQNEASVFSYWNTILTSQPKPKPPLLPPTIQQIMDQCNSNDHISTAMTGSNDNEFEEECTREWFGMTRTTTYPVATTIASGMSAQKIGQTRATTGPFSSNTNTTSTLG